MLFPPHHRTWILDPRAEVEIDRAIAENPQVEKQVAGVEWVLVRSPERGNQIAPDAYLYTNSPATQRASLITVLYKYNDSEVEVMSIWIR